VIPWVVVGDPANRRTRMFRAAAAALGTEVEVVSWHAVLDAPTVVDRPGPFILRLESVGEDDGLADRLRARGLARVAGWSCERTVRPGAGGELLAPRQAHEGFLAVLDDLEAWHAGRPDVVLQQPFGVIRTCFDKRATHEVLQAAGIPVPDRVEARDVQGLVAAAEAGPVFVKLTCGSSASGLGVLRGGGRVLMTTVRTIEAGRFNAFRVQRLEGRARDDTLAWLVGEGVHAERRVLRPRLDGAFFDLRVLVIEGEPRFAVVRCARHPITNLHLGGWRGDLTVVLERLGPGGRARLLDVCRAVGRVLPAGHLGVDIAITRGFRDVVVLEVNAFGDLLPGLRMDGLDPYGVQIVSRLPKHGGRMLHCLRAG
jgi:glutathione synthase/RimK-type ligase-like ATP-grasp enzyme